MTHAHKPAIRSFHPPARILMGPGPSNIHPRVLSAMAQPTIGHLDPAFAGMMEELKELLRHAFRTENAFTFPVSGPGSVGMETCFVNLVEPGDQVIVCRNGVFGGRMIENVQRAGGIPVVVECEWGSPVDPNQAEDAIRAHPNAKILAFVHAETSTGAQSDGAALCGLARGHGLLSIVDTVTSLGGSPVSLDEWGADASYSGSQKCLSCVPGLSPVSFSEAALAKVKARKSKCQSWFMDLTLVLDYWNAREQRTYHHTAPINSLYALHESLLMLKEEGLEKAWARHRRHHLALKAGLEAMGLSFVVPEGSRLPQLNAVRIPEGVADQPVRRKLLEEFNLEIGAGLGPLAGKIWRFGLMGHSCSAENVLFSISALDSVLADMGYPVDYGRAEAAAHEAYAHHSRAHGRGKKGA